eukprot:TRINITY_DN3222_c0_g1_i1.p1 TRINITY_DN3222_c0_g1~~TRINITY_DN3222_c0_g1_i1.p1  ORF type:complete len:109 (+),score=26.46 TRINITY_DN3222_c0_g1_i1:285-611(+)
MYPDRCSYRGDRPRRYGRCRSCGIKFIFGIQPTSPPINVMLMIMAVVAAAAAMQASGGLDYMIKIASGILRKNPRHITFIAPLVTYFFTMMAGTGHGRSSETAKAHRG